MFIGVTLFLQGTLQVRELITPISAPLPSISPQKSTLFYLNPRLGYFSHKMGVHRGVSCSLTQFWMITPLPLNPHLRTHLHLHPQPRPHPATARDYPQGGRGTPLTVPSFRFAQSSINLSPIAHLRSVPPNFPSTAYIYPPPQFLLLVTVLRLKWSAFTITLSFSSSWLLGNPIRPIPLCNNNYNDTSLSPSPLPW